MNLPVSFQTLADDCHAETIALRGGLARSANAETSEALYLPSGFVFDSAEQADAAFAGDEPRFLYGRYANPARDAGGAVALAGGGRGMPDDGYRHGGGVRGHGPVSYTHLTLPTRS